MYLQVDAALELLPNVAVRLHSLLHHVGVDVQTGDAGVRLSLSDREDGTNKRN